VEAICGRVARCLLHLGIPRVRPVYAGTLTILTCNTRHPRRNAGGPWEAADLAKEPRCSATKGEGLVCGLGEGDHKERRDQRRYAKAQAPARKRTDVRAAGGNEAARSKPLGDVELASHGNFSFFNPPNSLWLLLVKDTFFLAPHAQDRVPGSDSLLASHVVGAHKRPLAGAARPCM